MTTTAQPAHRNGTAQTLIRYDGRQLLRSATVRWTIALFLVIGLYALYYGKGELSRRQSHIQAEQADEQARFADTTVLGAKLKGQYFFWGVNKLADLPPDPFQGVSLGQSDLFPQTYYLGFTTQVYRLFQAELTNPRKLHIGNFDLAFVLVYLLPLLIIVLSFNALSGECEGGTLPLLLTTGLTERQIVGAKLKLRFGIALTLAWGLTGLAVLIMPLPPDGRLLIWLLGTALYAGFWVALSGLLVSLRQSSATTALLGLAAWLGLTTLIPAGLNVVLSAQFSPGVRNELMATARVTYGQTMALDSTLAYRTFYQRRPDLAMPDPTRYGDKEENPRWLHVAYGLSESKLLPSLTTYFEQVTTRSATQTGWQWLSPPASANTLFNALAHADQPDQMLAVRDLIRYGAAFREPFFQHLFHNQPVTPALFRALPRWNYAYPTDWSRVWWSLGQLLVWAVVLGTLAYHRLRQQHRPVKTGVISEPQRTDMVS